MPLSPGFCRPCSAPRAEYLCQDYPTTFHFCANGRRRKSTTAKFPLLVDGDGQGIPTNDIKGSHYCNLLEDPMPSRRKTFIAPRSASYWKGQYVKFPGYTCAWRADRTARKGSVIVCTSIQSFPHILCLGNSDYCKWVGPCCLPPSPSTRDCF